MPLKPVDCIRDPRSRRNRQFTPVVIDVKVSCMPWKLCTMDGGEEGEVVDSFFR